MNEHYSMGITGDFSQDGWIHMAGGNHEELKPGSWITATDEHGALARGKVGPPCTGEELSPEIIKNPLFEGFQGPPIYYPNFAESGFDGERVDLENLDRSGDNTAVINVKELPLVLPNDPSFHTLERRDEPYAVVDGARYRVELKLLYQRELTMDTVSRGLLIRINDNMGFIEAAQWKIHPDVNSQVVTREYNLRCHWEPHPDFPWMPQTNHTMVQLRSPIRTGKVYVGYIHAWRILSKGRAVTWKADPTFNGNLIAKVAMGAGT